jgi:DNA (cytosine-5)-methyltransferase 1
MTQGFSETGSFELVQAVEMDIAAAATYGLNHGTDHVHAGSIESWREGNVPRDIDVVIGGPPCQGFSALGKQDVLDQRNRLWREYALTIESARPQYFVLENVTQFLGSPQFRSLRRWTHRGGRLSDYTIRSYVLNAADFGSFQSRKRAVIVGRLRSARPVEPVTGDFAGRWRTVRDAFKDVDGHVEEIELPDRSYTFQGKTLPGIFSSQDLHLTRSYQTLSLNRFASIPAGGNRFDLPEHLKAECWKSHKSGSGDVMGRLNWDKPSVTIRTEFFKPEKGRYLHPTEDRAITHYEASILQGFPPTYKWVGSKVSIGRQIGNAVPVPLARALATAIAEAAGPSLG